MKKYKGTNQMLANTIKKSRFIFICGNGGSASTAEHFATDLIKRGYRAIALSSNSSVISMIANDYGYDQIFRRQISVLGNSKDLLITISCSGISENIIQAQETALDKGMTVYAFKTFKDSDNKDYGLLEDLHLKFAHEVAQEL